VDRQAAAARRARPAKVDRQAEAARRGQRARRVRPDAAARAVRPDAAARPAPPARRHRGTTGTGVNTLPFSFFIGADVTDQEPQPVATRANLLTIMKSHGFNYIRLRAFVDPRASDGYDKTNGYADTAHTVAFGKQIKDAGMGFLLDFHYSDNWADPGKQCVPVPWYNRTTIADLAIAVHDYTKDAIQQMIAGGARPDMVQIGNEITPGMLIHHCDSGGQPISGMNHVVTGSISNWTNLGMLLKAGVAGVREVDSTILIAMHIDRGNDLNSSRSFITNATNQGVAFDVFGESCYTAYQGQPSAWQNTFTMLASMFPNMKFIVAEYGPEQRAANDIMWNLPNNRGMGTFNWEPTTQGAWNNPGPRPVPAVRHHLQHAARYRGLRPDEDRLRQPAVAVALDVPGPGGGAPGMAMRPSEPPSNQIVPSSW
jgi:arabinogalactan endo-1,4-beta-galactosidase